MISNRGAKTRFNSAVICLLLQLIYSDSSTVGTKTFQNKNFASAWLPDKYPSPDDVKCNSGDSMRFCDPDSLIPNEQKDDLANILRDSPNRAVTLTARCFEGETVTNEKVQVQFAVALVGKMDLQFHRKKEPDFAAEYFAMKVHDRWGVGFDTPGCGGTGVLLFLSHHDRTIFISRGSALEPILTDRRLDRIIDDMKPILRNGKYADAIVNALRNLDTYLLDGEPGWSETIGDMAVQYFGLAWIFGIFGLVGWSMLNDRKKRKEYAKVASHLNEIDRARAEALQGRFQAKSCPICLEQFKIKENTKKDEQDESKEQSEKDENDKTTDSATKPTLLGSDGLPLKLLRCGHVFDETCWAEWVSSGNRGKIDKCPICQQDVGKPLNENQDRTACQPVGQAGPSTMLFGPTTSIASETQQNRALLRYTYERNFRLARLRQRYPHFVTNQQMERWTRVGYDGSLARDPSFVNNDPVRQAAMRNSSRSNSSTGFGGGRSGGGRGGRW